MKALLKNLFFTLAPKGRLSRGRASILMYHSIRAGADYFSSVSPQAFARQMAYLAEERIPVVALSELVRRLKAREPLGGAVALTFDDGYEDNYAEALPVLRRYGFPATVFVTTGLIGGEDKRGMRRLSVEQMREMAASGLIEFGAHTKTHPKLSRLGEAQAKEEMASSKAALEALLGAPVGLFAYPYGDFSAASAHIAGESGFDAVATVAEGLVGADADLLRLPRNSIDRTTSFAQFRGKVSRAIGLWVSLKP